MKFEIHNSNSPSQPYYWRIVANGRVLAHSETYVRKQSCYDAINIVKKNAATAPVMDLTRTAVRR